MRRDNLHRRAIDKTAIYTQYMAVFLCLDFTMVRVPGSVRAGAAPVAVSTP